MSSYVFDIEADGLLCEATKIHCLVLQGMGLTDSPWLFTNDGVVDNIPNGIRKLFSGSGVIGHNICGFDIPLLERIYPKLMKELKVDIVKKPGKFFDTFLFSCIRFPDIKGGHSLDAWANRLDMPVKKIAHEDWSVLSKAMLKRCVADVAITRELQIHMTKTAKFDQGKDERISFKKPLKLEQQVAYIHAQQTIRGVRFNVKKGVALFDLLKKRVAYLEEQILAEAPLLVRQPYSTVVKPFKMNGMFTMQVLDWYPLASDRQKANIRGVFTRIDITPMNLNSKTEVVSWLEGLGWRPHEFTPTGKPKITEKLLGLHTSKIGKLFQEMQVLKHRKRSLFNESGKKAKGALTKVRKDGRIAAEAMTCATPTSRYRHSGAVCNLPSACINKKTGELIWYPEFQKTPFGTEMRDLYCVAEGNTMLGVDLSGIEARMLAHYCFQYPGGPEMAKRIVSGDFHSYNASAWKVDRGPAKGGLYALMYGCGDAKLASVLGKMRKEGRKLKAAFWKANPAIKSLITDLEVALSRNGGYLIGLDGRMLFIREARKLLNSLLQHGAAVIFKQWMVECYKYNQSLTIIIDQVISYHDECQYDVCSTNKHDIRLAGKTYRDLAIATGELFRLNVALDAEYKVGQSWADCH